MSKLRRRTEVDGNPSRHISTRVESVGIRRHRRCTHSLISPSDSMHTT